MPTPQKAPDRDTQRGVGAALQRAFNGQTHEPTGHVGAEAAEADFAALLAQLNDPPPQYQ